MKEYPRYVTPGSASSDPLELAKETEKIVCRGKDRKYTAVYATGVYGGIATGYTCGCCLRCVFCWVDWSRDFPEKFGRFYSPEDVFHRLTEAAHKYKVNRLRISGAEPTLGKDHLLSLLEHVEESEFPLFILETNGILFGADMNYVRRISRFTKPHVRVSLKAGTPEAFTEKTGAKPEAFDIPFQAIRNLLDNGVSCHVAAMTDPRIMPANEKRNLLCRLSEIDQSVIASLEEEIVDPYKTTIVRMRKAGYDVAKFFSSRSL